MSIVIETDRPVYAFGVAARLMERSERRRELPNAHSAHVPLTWQPGQLVHVHADDCEALEARAFHPAVPWIECSGYCTCKACPNTRRGDAA